MAAPTETESACTERLDIVFRAQYERIARVIGRVIYDQARAEELAVEVFLKWWRNPQVHEQGAVGCLYRSAVLRTRSGKSIQNAMEINSEDQWVADQVAATEPDWQPDVVRARTRLAIAMEPRRRSAPWVLPACAAAALCIIALVLPQTRAL